jgi:O-antigen/teichoic acid export membrane protein
MFSNAIWNVLAGLSAAILGIALPPFLTRWLSPEIFGAWALCLQIATYVNVLNLGIQVIVAKLVADAAARGDLGERDRVVNTAIAVLGVAAMIGFGGMAYASANIGRLIPTLAPDLVAQVQTSLIVLALAFCLMLPLSVFGAVFIGLRDNRRYATALLISRVIGYFLILGACFWTRDIRWMALQYLVSTLIAGGLWYTHWRSRIEAPQLAMADVSRGTAVAILKDSATLAVWNVGMLLIMGLQLVVVARVDYPNLPFFAAASTLALFVSGTLQAICSTMVPQAAHLFALGEISRLRTMLLQMSRITTVISVAVSVPLILTAGPILDLWVGPIYATHAHVPLAILALAHALRNLLLAYVMVVVGLGRQRRLLLIPLIEGSTGLVAGYILGQQYGAPGVAAGMVVGAVVGVVTLFAYDLLGDIIAPISKINYLWFNVLRPFGGIALAVPIWLIDSTADIDSRLPFLALTPCLALSLFIGMVDQDRVMILIKIRQYLAAFWVKARKSYSHPPK